VFDGLPHPDRLPIPLHLRTQQLPACLTLAAAFSLAALVAFALGATYDGEGSDRDG
jgi:hypothetical protein